MDEQRLTRQEMLDALSETITTKRDDAVKYRKETGIEEVWLKCEEAYLGIDDANRHEFSNAKWAKPTSMQGPLTANVVRRDEVKSTAYVRLTSRYVDAGVSRVCELALPPDDKPFKFEPTPIPDMIAQPAQIEGMLSGGSTNLQPPMPQAAAMMPGTFPPPAPAAQPPQQTPAAPSGGSPTTATFTPRRLPGMNENDLNAQKTDAEANSSAERAEKRIWDWMVEAKYAGEMRKVLFDAGRIGVGVLKAPFPDTKRSIALTKVKEAAAIQINQKTVPSVAWIDPWNCFPAPGCGENIHNGDYFVQRDYLSPKSIKKLRGQKGYLNEQLDQVLQEGPADSNSVSNDENPHNKREKNKHRYEVWYFYGSITRQSMMLANPTAAKDIVDSQDEVYAIVTVINDKVVRAIFNPLDSGRFPYNAICWSRRAGSWAGVGVGEQVFLPQRMCNAATRSMMNNAGMSSGSQIIVDKGAISPADGNWTITPNKIWWKSPDSSADDVRKAFMTVEFPDRQQLLMNIIEYAFRLAEEASNIPLIAQGQSNDVQSPDTYGAAKMQNDNANVLLRSIGYNLDDSITEPVVQGFYEWLLLDPEVPDDEKGDFNINAHGTIAMVERGIQNQFIGQTINMSLNPAFELSPAKYAQELLKAQRIDPRKVSLTDEEKAAMAQKAPPEDPRIVAAKIAADGRIKAVQATAQADLQVHQAEYQQDVQKNNALWQHEANEAERDRQLELVVQQVNERIQSMKEGTAKEISLNELKGMLAATTMKLNVQKSLSNVSTAVDLHKHRVPAAVITPPTEPAGRAPNGEAWQQ